MQSHELEMKRKHRKAKAKFSHGAVEKTVNQNNITNKTVDSGISPSIIVFTLMELGGWFGKH